MALTVSVDELVNNSKNPLLQSRAGWGRVRLGEIATVLNGYAFKSDLFTRDEGVPLIRIRDVGSSASETRYKGEFDTRYLVKAGELLVGMDGDFNCARWRGEPSLLNQRVCKITVHSKKYDDRFLDYLLPGYLKAINVATSSTTVKHLSSRSIEEIPLPMPPLAEQVEIVQEIEKQFSRLDEAVANLKRVKANLKRYIAAVLKAAVEGRLVPTDGNWKTLALGDIALSIRNGYSSKPDAESGTPILRISAVRPMALDVADVRYLSGALKEYESFLISPGDVLFTRYNGNRDYVGVCACVPPGIEQTVYPDKLIRVRVPVSTLLPEFLAIAASTGNTRAFLESKIRTTAGQSGISGGDLKALPLVLPSPVEQRRIVDEIDLRFTLICGVEAQVDANLKRAERMRQAVLQTAFTASPDARQ